ncbi:MAG: hypothetical protein WBP45_08450 [Daejeonella sp.]
MVDVSPSEQLDGKLDDIKAMGLVFALTERKALDLVGSEYPKETHKLRLKKWASSNAKYKTKFIEHAKELLNSATLLFGFNVSSISMIKETGYKYWESYMGKIPAPSSFNKKNRPRVKMGNYKIEETLVTEYEILIDDLIIIGWYAEALVTCFHTLIKINENPVKLEVLLDRLPNEQGGDLYYKATLLKELCNRASLGLVEVVGLPERPDVLQRDILTDNIAGLAYEINKNINSPHRQASTLFKFNRKNIE